MRKSLFFIAFISLIFSVSAQTREQRLKEHLYFLAADSLKGRAAGSAESKKAADYIIAQFEGMGLRPFYTAGYRAPFTNSFYANDREMNDIVGYIPGNDPALKDEFVVIGAHYDHLGVRNGKVYNGADDNASGTSAVIEIARQLIDKQTELKRSVLIVCFDGEELGLLGSNYLAQRLAAEKRIEKVALMMSIDMVGWYRQSGKLIFEGCGTIKDGDKKLTELAQKLGVAIKLKRFEQSILTATDTEGFAKMGVPTLAVTTGVKSPYHKPEDDADLIDYPGLSKITDLLTQWVIETSSDELFRASGDVAKKHMTKPPIFEGGFTAGLGSSHLDMPHRCALDGRTDFAWNAGASMLLNFKWLSTKIDLFYEKSKAGYPDLEDLYGHSYTYWQEAITVPVTFIYNLRTQYGTPHIGLGLYYSHVFSAGLRKQLAWDYTRRDQWGIQWGIGYRIGNFDFNAIWRYQLNDITGRTEDPGMKNHYGTFQVGYYF